MPVCNLPAELHGAPPELLSTRSIKLFAEVLAASTPGACRYQALCCDPRQRMLSCNLERERPGGCTRRPKASAAPPPSNPRLSPDVRAEEKFCKRRDFREIPGSAPVDLTCRQSLRFARFHE